MSYASKYIACSFIPQIAGVDNLYTQYINLLYSYSQRLFILNSCFYSAR